MFFLVTAHSQMTRGSDCRTLSDRWMEKFRWTFIPYICSLHLTPSAPLPLEISVLQPEPMGGLTLFWCHSAGDSNSQPPSLLPDTPPRGILTLQVNFNGKCSGFLTNWAKSAGIDWCEWRAWTFTRLPWQPYTFYGYESLCTCKIYSFP